MIINFDKETELSFSVIPPLYLPFYNEWGANAYTTHGEIKPIDYSYNVK